MTYRFNILLLFDFVYKYTNIFDFQNKQKNFIILNDV